MTSPSEAQSESDSHAPDGGLVVMHTNDDIVTVEGSCGCSELHPLQAAFLQHDAFQCGF